MFPAQRLQGYNKPTVWTKFAQISLQTQGTNLGQGFPSWHPPQFYRDALENVTKTSSHQYTRAYGLPKLVDTIARIYSPLLQRKIDPLTNVCVGMGAVGCLNSLIQGIINPGDEVVLIDPSYDAYRPQVQFAGGIVKSIKLRPRVQQSKQDILNRPLSDRYKVLDSDIWELDYQELENALSSKTKMILINSPHNPTGKVFSKEEIEKISQILQKYPDCIVCEDSVYEHLLFDIEPLQLPRFSHIPEMRDRTISVHSAGKLFSCTGSRMGWVIGPENIVKSVQAYHQYNVFCLSAFVQEATAIALEQAETNGYWKEFQKHMTGLRNQMLDILLESNLDIDLWVPQAGYFAITDSSRLNLLDKYKISSEGTTMARDYSLAHQIAYENGVITIPCSDFYDQETKIEKYIRFAFCKDANIIEQARSKLK